MCQESVRADQVVDLVEYRHEEITGLGIAAHEGVGAACLDHFNGVLDNVGIVADRLNIELAVRKAEFFESLVDFLVISDQDRFGESLLLCHEGALQDILRVSSGDGNAHGLAGIALDRLVNESLELGNQFHIVLHDRISFSLSV